jgi:tetratricopeptide (TPR) repeat protein
MGWDLALPAIVVDTRRGVPRYDAGLETETYLIALDGAHSLTLAPLPVPEARDLLLAHIGSGRIAAEPEAVDDIITRTVRLPLALSVFAARPAAHPTFPLRVLADELTTASGGLDALDGGHAAANVRAVFSWSYQRLSPPARYLFRLLGVHCGQDVTVPATASLAAVGNVHGQAASWDSIGWAHHQLGEYGPAEQAYRQAIALYGTLRDRYNVAATLVNLGDTHHGCGALAAARDAWTEALGILRELDHRDAEQVAARLRQVDTEEHRPRVGQHNS